MTSFRVEPCLCSIFTKLSGIKKNRALVVEYMKQHYPDRSYKIIGSSVVIHGEYSLMVDSGSGIQRAKSDFSINISSILQTSD